MIFNPHYVFFDDFPESPTEYLTFTDAAPSPYNIGFTLSSTGRYWDGKMYYSTDKDSWLEWDGSAIQSVNGKIYIAGVNNTRISTRDTANCSFSLYHKAGYEVNCSGNIETLLDWRAVADGNHPVMGAYAFEALFKGCSYLGSAPTLPATTLTEGCYREMFYQCVLLTTAPSLPATNLVANCYNSMFEKCGELTTIPAFNCNYNGLCCESMFDRCSKVKVSQRQIDLYQTAFFTNSSNTSQLFMFDGTGGTYTGSGDIGTYYTSNPVV